MTTNSILNEMNESEKFIETQIPRSENFEENLKLIEKTRKRIADTNTSSTTKQNDKINNFFN